MWQIKQYNIENSQIIHFAYIFKVQITAINCVSYDIYLLYIVCFNPFILEGRDALFSILCIEDRFQNNFYVILAPN